MLHEWKLDGITRNFGDALTDLLATKKMRDDTEKMYFVVGSVICNEVISGTLHQGYKPVFIGCGWRGELLESSLVKEATFIGVRGPLTRQVLLQHRIDTPVIMDSAYRVTEKIPAGKKHGRSIFMPHIQDPKRFEYKAEELGVDEIIQAEVTDEKSIINTLELISGASFVLAGAMHAAIVAHGYEVSFAPFDGGYINCEPKWDDWLRSINVEKTKFFDNANQGRSWYTDNVE